MKPPLLVFELASDDMLVLVNRNYAYDDVIASLQHNDLTKECEIEVLEEVETPNGSVIVPDMYVLILHRKQPDVIVRHNVQLPTG